MELVESTFRVVEILNDGENAKQVTLKFVEPPAPKTEDIGSPEWDEWNAIVDELSAERPIVFRTTMKVAVGDRLTLSLF